MRGTLLSVILIPQSREKDPLGQRALHSPEWILRCAQDDEAGLWTFT